MGFIMVDVIILIVIFVGLNYLAWYLIDKGKL